MRDRPPHLARGHRAEDLACARLAEHGLRLRERNYRCPYGEIDLILEDGKSLVFVEVRYRRQDRFGSPAETVDGRKQRRLRAAAKHYLQRHPEDCNKPCRFDIVAITGSTEAAQSAADVRWLQNAF